MNKPGRPLGVALAIIVSSLLFSILPLMGIGMIAVVAYRFSTLDFPEGGPEPFAIGGDFIGFAPSSIFLQTILALIFLLLAVFAWRGRPAFMRMVFSGAVVGLTFITLLSIILSAMAGNNLEAGLSSSNSFWESIAWGDFVMRGLVSLYVMWYMNRAPARAFYRGYFLPGEVNLTPQPVVERDAGDASTSTR